jgi:cobalt-precorrin 5A hydrolase
MNESLAIWQVRSHSNELADLLHKQLNAKIYAPRAINEKSQTERFASVFHSHSHWIMLAATGIAVRFLNNLMQNKNADPAVVVLDEAGRFATSLLGGHEAGANELAYRVANEIGAVPVISTATEALKPYIIGIGCRKNVSDQAIKAAILHALGEITLNQIREIATIDLKSKEPGLIEFCQRQHIPLRILQSKTINARQWVTQSSNWVRQNIGLDGVCEPCALTACSRGKLIIPKITLNGVAVAVVKDMDWRSL